MDRPETKTPSPATADPSARTNAVPSSALKPDLTGNGLLEALIQIARHHGVTANRAELIRGLPTDRTGLPLKCLEEAARRLDLNVRIEQRDLLSIPTVTLPVIVMLETGTAHVLEKVDGSTGTATLVSDGLEDGGRSVRLSDLVGSKLPVVIFVSPSAKKYDVSNAVETPKSWFWSAVRRFWPNYLQVIIAAFIGNMLGLASPLFIMNVYDRVIPNLAIPTLWVLTIGVAIAFLFDFILKLLRMQIVDETGRRVDMAVAGRLFDHFLRIKMVGRPASTGAVANQVRDLDSVRDALTSSTVIAATDFLFIGIFVWVMWFLVGPLAWVPLVAVPVVIAVTCLVQVPLTRALSESQKDSARRQSVLVETISSLETIKVSGGESWFRKAWDRAVAAASRSTAKARYWANLASSFTAVVFQSVSIVIVVWGVFLVLDGQITVGALIAANILSGRVLTPLNNITQTLTRLLHARTALRGLNALMKVETEKAATAPDLPSLNNGDITFSDVSLRYAANSVPALSKVSFSVKSGEKVGIIGRVGSGKSSLVRVLSGLYEPESGSVLLGGVDTRQLSPADLRKTVGLCLQDAELFGGTLRENILLGAPLVSAADLERAVKLAGVDTFASSNPNGLNMLIEERGRSLSGGQKQAVALARCLIRSPRVLCLDEPTAYLDVMTERLLCDRLSEIAKTGITLFIATHRDGPLELVDRLLLLDKGRLLMDGPKDQVIARLRSGAAPNTPTPPPEANNVRVDEAFANDVRAALDQTSRKGVWFLLLAVLLLMATLGVWAYFAELEEVTTGEGRVIPSSQIQIVESLEGGLVAEIFVKEGDVVEAGQSLVRIDDTGFAADLGELEQQRAALQIKSKRLEAEARGGDLSLTTAETSLPVAAREIALFEARKIALGQEISVIEQQLSQRRLEKVELETRLESTSRSSDLLDEELRRARELADVGAFPKMDLLRLERDAQSGSLEVAVLKASIPRADAAILEAMARKESAVLSFRAKVHEELTLTLNELTVLEETIKSAKDKVRRTMLRAPVRGIINKFLVATIGAVVSPGETISEIVPLDDTLLVEAQIRPQDVAFLYPGQTARVRVTAYDYTIYGDLTGKVERISADTITNEEGMTFYRVIVRTDKNALGTQSNHLPIIPGMVVSASILTGNKTVLDYLLKPIKKARSEAFRER